MAEVPVGCGKEPSLNLTSEPPPFLVPKIRFSLQPWWEGGESPRQNSTTAWTTPASYPAPTHPKVVLSAREEGDPLKGPPVCGPPGHNPLRALATHQPSLAGAPFLQGQILTHLGSLRSGGEAAREEPKPENHRTRTQGKEILDQQDPKSSRIPSPSPCQPASQPENFPFRNSPPTPKTPAHKKDLDLAQALMPASPEGTPRSCLLVAA